jgi:hypothetical protein
MWDSLIDTYLEVTITFLTGPSIITYHNFDCDEKKMIWKQKNDVY